MRRATLALAVVVGLCLSSCTIPTRIELFNNANQTVQISTGSREDILDPGETARLGSVIGMDKVEVQIGSDVRVYEIDSGIPEKFVSWSGWGPWSKRTARLQLDPDGKIWLLGSEQVAPGEHFLEQPSGFPLVPDAA